MRPSPAAWTVGLLFLGLLLTPLAGFVASLPGLHWHDFPARAAGPLGTSLLATVVALAVIVALGTPLAWIMSRATRRWGLLLELLLLVPLLMPPLVMGLLLAVLLGPASPVGAALTGIGLAPLGSLGALVLAEVYEAAPYYVLTAQAAFAQVDPGLEEVWLTLGRPPRHVLVAVSLPAAAPGLRAAFTLALARALGAFGAAIVVAYHPQGLPVAIWLTLEEVGLGSALPMALLLLVIALPLPMLLKGRLEHAALRA